MKTINRTIIIRDQDLSAFVKRAIRTKLYDAMEIEPMTYQSIQQENLVKMLKGQYAPPQEPLPDLHYDMVCREKRLYDRRYLTWQFTMDYPHGQIYVKSPSKGSWPDPLLRVTVEKTVE